MFTYILQVILFQVVFLAVYDFFLSKETFHTYNRWYLLGAPMLSFLLPMIQISSFQEVVPESLMLSLPELLISPETIAAQTSSYSGDSINYLDLIFYGGVGVFGLLFLGKLIKILGLISTNQVIKKPGHSLVLLVNQTHAFSFFRYVFLGTQLSKEKQEVIIKHELIHVQQKHSLDLLFFELFRIIMWFNPALYLYQRRVTLLHEYITDAVLLQTTQKHDYFNKLLAQTFDIDNLSFVNQFYKHSLIKKRIAMMTKNKSKQIKKAKYLLLVPVLAGMLFYTSCSNTDSTAEIEQSNSMNELSASGMKNTSIVPFAILESKPSFKGANTTGDVPFYMQVKSFVAKNFDSNIAANLDLQKGPKKIYAAVTIDATGAIERVGVRAPHPNLKEEMERVISLFPAMNPGTADGVPVATKLVIPLRIENE